MGGDDATSTTAHLNAFVWSIEESHNDTAEMSFSTQREIVGTRGCDRRRHASEFCDSLEGLIVSGLTMSDVHCGTTEQLSKRKEG